MSKRIVHTITVAILFILGWALIGWPVMGLFLTLSGSSELSALVTFVVYLAGFFSIYFVYLRRQNFAPWRIEE